MVNATSTEALYTLLQAALDEGKTELAVRIGYWGENGTSRVAEAVTRVREERGLTQTPEWTIYYYPANGPVGMVEFFFQTQEDAQGRRGSRRPPENKIKNLEKSLDKEHNVW